MTNPEKRNIPQIGAYTFDEYCKNVENFHGTIAPGMLICGFMVDLARKNPKRYNI